MAGKITQQLKNAVDRAYYKTLVGDEPGLVVGWADMVIMLIYTALMFAMMGFMMDFTYNHIHDDTSGLYTEADVTNSEDVYSMYKFIPWVAVTVVIFYIVNYSSRKRREG
jgi:hypothetical protein